MKKVNLKIAAAILIAITAVVFYSCRKKFVEDNPQFKDYGTALVGYPLIDSFPIEYLTSSISFNGDFLQFSN